MMSAPHLIPSPLDRALTVTYFFSFGANEKREQQISLRDLVPKIRNTTNPLKTKLPWLKLARFGEKRSHKDGVPVDRQSLRHNENVLTISGIEADYDAEIITVDEAVGVLRKTKLAAMVYTSPSHTADTPRWRVLCPLSKDLPPAARVGLLERLNGLFHGALAGESFTLSQSYYFGSLKSNPSHQVELVEGAFLDLRPDLDDGAVGKPKTDIEKIAPIPSTRSPDKSKFVEAVINNALSKVRGSGDGQKHHTLRAQSKLLGGYHHAGSFSIADMAQTLVNNLSDTVKDKKAALKTALWGLEKGQTLPIDIPDLPPRVVMNPEPPPPDPEDPGYDADNVLLFKAQEPDNEPPPDWSWGKAGATGPATRWPTPLDIFNVSSENPPQVTSDHIPDRLWPFVYDTALRMGVDPTTVALGSIVTCASVIHDDWQIQPKRYDKTWSESARLWGCIVGDPSSMKSPVIMACTRIIDRLEAESRRRHDADMDVYEKAHALWKKAKDSDEPEPKRPKLDRYLVEGATMEAFQEVLRDDPKAQQRAITSKVLCRQDEMSEWAGNLDRYGGGKGGGDRGAYLRLYNGGRYTVDRIARGSFAVSNWSACFLTGCQPEPIQKIARDAAEDGLLQRFMYAVPAPSGEGIDQPENEEAIESYQNLIRALTAMHPITKETGYGHEHVVFHEHAHAHREEIDKAARAIATIPDTSNRVKSTLGKWPGLFARLCLTFHMIENAGKQLGFRYVISEGTAAQVKDYMLDIILPHLIRADATMFLTPQTGHARWIAGHILARKLETITTREVVQSYRALRSPEQSRELATTMASLVAVGWLDPMDPRNPLNPVSSWRVNPDVHARFSEQAEHEAETRESVKRAIRTNAAKYVSVGFLKGDEEL